MELLHLNDQSFDENVLNSKGIVIVDFFATWCGPCRMLGPVLEQVQEEMADSIKIVKVDVDDAEKVSKRYGVMSIPTMVILKDGQEIDRLVGYRGKQELVEIFGNYTHK